MILRNACISLTALMFALSACSKDKNNPGSEPVKPLSDGERARFNTTADNVEQSTTWQNNQVNPAPSVNKKEEVKPKQGKANLDNLVSENCEIQPVDVNEPQPTPGSVIMEIGMKVIDLPGKQCPIRFGFSFKSSTTATSERYDADMALKLDYEALAQEAKDALDISKLVLDIGIKMNASQNGGSVTGSGSGEVVSKTDGLVKLQFNVSGSGSDYGYSSIATVRFTYPDNLVVELKQTENQSGDQPAKLAYFLNNVAITEKEYSDYMDKLSLEQAGAKSSFQSMN